ncbi:MAG: hypothetical protein EOO14_16895, partial [Chitinophagaceae bacterium]
MLSRLHFFAAVLLLFFCAACSSSKNATTALPVGPSAEREFRAAWVATVANINWPSKPGLPVDSQKKE